MTPAEGGAETLPDPSSPGTVVLELGGGMGAAIVRTAADYDGREIEIRPEPGEWTGRHVAVRSRPMPGAVAYAAIFGGLTAGSYRFRDRPAVPDGVELTVEVEGGRVTYADWPA